MKPNWVLSDEQCTIRFRKVRQEKINEVELDIEEEQEVLAVKKETSPVDKSKFIYKLKHAILPLIYLSILMSCMDRLARSYRFLFRFSDAVHLRGGSDSSIHDRQSIAKYTG